MKFIKEAIEFPSSKNKVKECVHPLREEKRISRKWGHTWYFDDNYDIVKVKAKDGTVLRRGEPFEAENGDKLVINGFDPDTNTVYVVEADDYDPNFDGGADYAVEDIVKIFKYWDKQVSNPTSGEDLKEAKINTIRRWGHTWYFDEAGDIEKVKTKDGTILEKEETFADDRGNVYHIDGFDPETNTVFVFTEDSGSDSDYAVEDILSVIKEANPMPSKDPAQGYVIDFPKDVLNDLPGFPEDMHWYANRYALDFKTSDSSSYYTVTGTKEDVDRFIRDFDLGNFVESLNQNKGSKLNEETEHAIYRVTYVVDKDANIFSAVMINARGEADAQSVFLKKFPGVEILGIVKLDDIEVETNKKKGMSLIEDLEVGELEHEEAEEGNNPEPPVAGEESAAASLINSLIRDEWLAIEQYNSAMVNLKEYGVDEKIIEVLNHIMFDENTHVGNLQEVLALLAPATNKIEKGNEQAEQILNTEDTKSGDDEE